MWAAFLASAHLLVAMLVTYVAGRLAFRLVLRLLQDPEQYSPAATVAALHSVAPVRLPILSQRDESTSASERVTVRRRAGVTFVGAMAAVVTTTSGCAGFGCAPFAGPLDTPECASWRMTKGHAR